MTAIIEFKDSYFLEALVKGTDDYDGSKIDKNGDGKISEKEASVVRGLRLSDFKIRCIDEISYFTALETLYCDHNQLTSLDVSKNTELMGLNCDNNQLTSLDLSKNTEVGLAFLRQQSTHLIGSEQKYEVGLFYCNNNQLTSLDVSKNTELDTLHCDNNQLTSLDVSKNTEVEMVLLRQQSTHLIRCKQKYGVVIFVLQQQSTHLIGSEQKCGLYSLNCSGNNLKSVIVQRNYNYRLISSLDAITREYGDIISYVF